MFNFINGYLLVGILVAVLAIGFIMALVNGTQDVAHHLNSELSNALQYAADPTRK